MGDTVAKTIATKKEMYNLIEQIEAIGEEILALKGVIGLVFYSRNGDIISVKSNIETAHWVVPKTSDEIERKSLICGEMICEIASEMSAFGKLEAVTILHEKRCSFLIPLNELCLGITANKTVEVSQMIRKVKKIIKKYMVGML